MISKPKGNENYYYILFFIDVHNKNRREEEENCALERHSKSHGREYYVYRFQIQIAMKRIHTHTRILFTLATHFVVFAGDENTVADRVYE